MVEVSTVSAKHTGNPTEPCSKPTSELRPARCRPTRLGALLTTPLLFCLWACERSTEGPPLSAAPAAPAKVASVPKRCVVPRATPEPPRAMPPAECPAPRGSPPLMRHGVVTFNDAPSSPSITVEIATSVPARARGLMYRTSMAQDTGMLFTWPDEARRSFWMKNTCLPLDMLFIAADGLIVGILEQVPTLNQQPRANPCPAAHVLEVNAGWTRKHGIEPGQRISLATDL